MLSKRQMEILRILEDADDFITVENIAIQCGLSKRTIHTELNRISDYVRQGGRTLEKKRGIGVSLRSQSQLSSKESKPKTEEFFDSNLVLERRLEIMRRLLFEDGFLTYQALSEEFLVSKTSIVKDFEFILSILTVDSAIHFVSDRQGTCLKGSEVDIQRAMLQFNRFVMAQSDVHAKEMLPKNLDILAGYYGDEIIRTCQQIFYSYIRKNIHAISDYYVQNVLNILIILVYRAFSGYHHEQSTEVSEKFFEESSHTILEKITLRLGIEFTAADELFFSKQLTLNRFEKIGSNQMSDVFTQKLLEGMSLNLKVNFLEDNKLKEQLSEHITAMMYRLQSRVSVENPFLDQIKKEFALVFNLLSMMIVEIEKEYQIVFNENEIAFLTIYFQSAIERAKINKRILVVCQMGLATSELLLHRINQALPSLDSLELSSVAELEYMELDNYDFIISTVHLDIPGKNVILVSPFLTENDMEKIKQAGYSPSTISGQTKITQFHHLHALLGENEIFLDTDYKDKDSLLKGIGKKLVEKQIVRPAFVNDLFHREKLGATDLPMGVAIPHGSPQNSLKSQVILLKNQRKIKWCDYFVDIIFVICLSQEDRLRTKGVLSDIYQIIDSPQLLKLIRKEKNRSDLAKKLFGGSENE